MQRFEGRVALVSGGLGAMGMAIGRRLAQEGATVVLGDLAEPDVTALHAAFSGLPLPVVLRLDVTAAESWQAAVAEVEARFGRLDVLVNNAGVLTPAPQVIDDIGLEEWRRVFAVNVEGVLLGIQAALRSMKSRRAGSIVNLGSVASYVGSRDNGTYGASKAAVRNLTKQAALSAARLGYGVRVNAVHPGFVWTPLVEGKAVAQHGSRETAQAAFRAMNPLHDIVSPDDVAAAVAFLASDDARMITGADLVVDGGRLIQ
ncbi:SDR family NAD(P)-dependent oxidoreductase [Roseicella aquatilis]|uniref:SDR family oxidoreductase n=1 Tax=Roseicella aquatilis TaxID=2527868 RepID=A0A4R4D4E5_9PROT|nr:SDR family oxidoreductase [Roseicella aquatilis]TCZ52937.1 SDR family oxidoreductase [Roseicella aquatilis]